MNNQEIAIKDCDDKLEALRVEWLATIGTLTNENVKQVLVKLDWIEEKQRRFYEQRNKLASFEIVSLGRWTAKTKSSKSK